jgi:hypothetical protein
MTDKAIDAFKELDNEIGGIRSSYDLSAWKAKASNNIIRIYGSNSKPEEQIASLQYRTGFQGGSNIEQIKAQAKQMIIGLIKEIERFGLPEKNKTDKEHGVSINITQSLRQDTKINLSLVIDAIQNELTGQQLKEVQQIIEEPKIETATKKAKILDKLKSFGSDVASNIIANILTNPSLFG